MKDPQLNDCTQLNATARDCTRVNGTERTEPTARTYTLYTTRSVSPLNNPPLTPRVSEGEKRSGKRITLCLQPGCGNAAAYRGRCVRHGKQSEQNRNDDRAGVYTGDGGAWRKLSLQVRREQPLCEHCLSKGIVERGQQTDHIVPVSENPGLRLYRPNCENLCLACHAAKSLCERTGQPLEPFFEAQRARVLAALAEEQGDGPPKSFGISCVRPARRDALMRPTPA